MSLKGRENRAQKTVRELHTRSCNIHDGDTFFDGDGLEEIPATRGARGNFRPLAIGVAGIQDIDWNIFLYGREHSRRMQDFGSKVGQLCRLVETDHFDPPRLGHSRGSVVIMPSTSVQISIRSA